MTPFDPSFVLYFSPAARGSVLERLARSCPEEAGALRAAREGAGGATVEMDVVFRLPMDEALRGWAENHREMQRGPIGTADIGRLSLRLEALDVDLGGGPAPTLRLDLSPLTKQMGRCCHDSEAFRRALIECLERCQGLAGHLDAGDGSVTPFWTP